MMSIHFLILIFSGRGDSRSYPFGYLIVESFIVRSFVLVALHQHFFLLFFGYFPCDSPIFGLSPLSQKFLLGPGCPVLLFF